MQASSAEERREKDQSRSGDKRIITMLSRHDEEEFYLGEGSIRQLKFVDGFNKPVLFSRDYKKGDIDKSRSSEVFSSERVLVEVVESVHTESLGA